MQLKTIGILDPSSSRLEKKMRKSWFRAAILADEVLEKVAPVPSSRVL